MKYSLILIAVLSICFSCKSKKSVVGNAPSMRDTIYVENPETGELTMVITDIVNKPDGDWKLININNQHDDEMERVSLSINAKKANGNDGCNSYFCDLIQVDKSKIKFGSLSKTERECMVPAKHAQVFYKNLQAVTNYSASGLYLLLKDDNGKLLLRFSKKESE